MNEKAAEAIITLFKSGYTCDPDPPYPGGLQGFEQDLKQMFSQYFDPAHVESEFALPTDFQDFLLAIDGSFYKRNWASRICHGIDFVQYEIPIEVVGAGGRASSDVD